MAAEVVAVETSSSVMSELSLTSGGSSRDRSLPENGFQLVPISTDSCIAIQAIQSTQKHFYY